jgi:hypothetical protein
MTNSDANICAHEPCDCRVADDIRIEDDQGALYCSEGCRDGEGCNHPGCACADAS